MKWHLPVWVFTKDLGILSKARRLLQSSTTFFEKNKHTTQDTIYVYIHINLRKIAMDYLNVKEIAFTW